MAVKIMEHVYLEEERLAEANLIDIENMGISFKGKRVLDVGCGTGTYSRLFAKHGARRVVGVDIVARNIDVAAECNAGDGVEFVCSNVETWKTVEKFDFIFARGVVYYCKDFAGILEHFYGFGDVRCELFLTLTSDTCKSRLINSFKKIARAMPAFLQVLLRDMVALIVYVSQGRCSGERESWATIKQKANTVFFPANTLVSVMDARQALDRVGFDVITVFEGQGNARYSSEYGLLATKRE